MLQRIVSSPEISVDFCSLFNILKNNLGKRLLRPILDINSPHRFGSPLKESKYPNLLLDSILGHLCKYGLINLDDPSKLAHLGLPIEVLGMYMYLLPGHCKQQSDAPVADPVWILVALFPFHGGASSLLGVDPLVDDLAQLQVRLCCVVVTNKIVEDNTEDLHHCQVCVLEEGAQAD